MLGEDSLVSMVRRKQRLHAGCNARVGGALGADGKDAPKRWRRPTFRAALLPPHGPLRSCWCMFDPNGRCLMEWPQLLRIALGPAHSADLFWSLTPYELGLIMGRDFWRTD